MAYKVGEFVFETADEANAYAKSLSKPDSPAGLPDNTEANPFLEWSKKPQQGMISDNAGRGPTKPYQVRDNPLGVAEKIRLGYGTQEGLINEYIKKGYNPNVDSDGNLVILKGQDAFKGDLGIAGMLPKLPVSGGQIAGGAIGGLLGGPPGAAAGGAIGGGAGELQRQFIGKGLGLEQGVDLPEAGKESLIGVLSELAGPAARGAGKVLGKGYGQVSGLGAEAAARFTQRPSEMGAMRGLSNAVRIDKVMGLTDDVGKAVEVFKQKTFSRAQEELTSLAASSPDLRIPTGPIIDSIKKDLYESGINRATPTGGAPDVKALFPKLSKQEGGHIQEISDKIASLGPEAKPEDLLYIRQMIDNSDIYKNKMAQQAAMKMVKGSGQDHYISSLNKLRGSINEQLHTIPEIANRDALISTTMRKLDSIAPQLNAAAKTGTLDKVISRNPKFQKELIEALADDPKGLETLEQLIDLSSAQKSSKYVREGLAGLGLVATGAGFANSGDPSTLVKGGLMVAAFSPRVASYMFQAKGTASEATKGLMRNLSLNPRFISMFVTKPAFQRATMKALDNYELSQPEEKPGLSGE